MLWTLPGFQMNLIIALGELESIKQSSSLAPGYPWPPGVILSKARCVSNQNCLPVCQEVGAEMILTFPGAAEAWPFRNVPEQSRSHRDPTSLGPGSCFLGPLAFTGGGPRPAHVLTATSSSRQAQGWLVPSPTHAPVLPEPRNRAVSSGQHPVGRARDRLPGSPACPPLVPGT